MNLKQLLTRTLTNICCKNNILYDAKILHYQPTTFNFNNYHTSKILINDQYNPLQIFKTKKSCSSFFDYSIEMNTSYYQPNYFNSLKNKFQISKLRFQHDPNFNMESFKRGTKQVITACYTQHNIMKISFN